MARRWDSAAASLRLRSADFFCRHCQHIDVSGLVRLEALWQDPKVAKEPMIELTARA